MTSDKTPVPADTVEFHSRRLSAVVVPLLLLALFGGGVASCNYGEIYPFAAWTMYSRTPAKIDYYTLMVHEIDGKALSPPELIVHTQEFRKDFFSASAYARLKSFFAALDQATSGKPGGYESFLETQTAVENILRGHDVIYEPLDIRCNPLHFYRDGIAAGASSFGRFQTGETVPREDMYLHAKTSLAMAPAQ